MVPAYAIALLKLPIVSLDAFEMADGRAVPMPCHLVIVRMRDDAFPTWCVPGDGLIGMEFLEMAFDSLHLDLRRGRFALRPRHTAK